MSAIILVVVIISDSFVELRYALELMWVRVRGSDRIECITAGADFVVS